VIGKAKKSQLFKCIKAYCIPVYYDNQEGWMNGEIFDNWFHKYFVPEVQAFLKERITTESDVAATECPFSY
jgi:hypothetical protein